MGARRRRSNLQAGPRSSDEDGVLVWPKLMSEGKVKGWSRRVLIMIIAAAAEADDNIVATDNEKGFAGMKTPNPMRSSA
jgi:hypothetical protein